MRPLQRLIRERDEPRNGDQRMQSESDMLTQPIRTFGDDTRTAAALIRHPRVQHRHPPMCARHPATAYRASVG
jgi:hypothetical protein